MLASPAPTALATPHLSRKDSRMSHNCDGLAQDKGSLQTESDITDAAMMLPCLKMR